ncbi:MAG TPA: M50 family metallopeptidase [Blastocatellia bacterium]|nr:M50 family metallopeptidase [Blastocatellia bacterium]
MQTQSEVKESFKLLVLASMLTLVLWFIPFAEVITYPIRLLVTYIHEAGHALAALATFGSVNRIALDWSGSGVTWTRGGWGLAISSAGYLSTILYGSALLLFLRRARNARTAALLTAGLLLFITVFFAGNSLAWLTGAIFGAGCVALALKGKPKLTHFLMSFLAVQCVLNALYDLRSLLFLSAFDSAIATDAGNMSAATGGLVPAIVWAIGWSILAVAILVWTLVIYYRSLRSRASAVEDEPLALLLEEQSKAAHPHL